MAKQKSGSERAAWEVDFVESNLGKAEKELMKKWDVKGEATLDEIVRLVSEGYKLSVSRDPRNDTCIASLTSPQGPAGTRRKCLTGRGPDMPGAMRCLMYKHVIMFEGDWGGAGNLAGDFDGWG